MEISKLSTLTICIKILRCIKILEVVQWILTMKYFLIDHIAFNEFNLLEVNILIRGRKDIVLCCLMYVLCGNISFLILYIDICQTMGGSFWYSDVTNNFFFCSAQHPRNYLRLSFILLNLFFLSRPVHWASTRPFC